MGNSGGNAVEISLVVGQPQGAPASSACAAVAPRRAPVGGRERTCRFCTRDEMMAWEAGFAYSVPRILYRAPHPSLPRPLR